MTVLLVWSHWGSKSVIGLSFAHELSEDEFILASTYFSRTVALPNGQLILI